MYCVLLCFAFHLSSGESEDMEFFQNAAETKDKNEDGFSSSPTNSTNKLAQKQWKSKQSPTDA